MKVLRVGGLAAETTTSQPVSILESVKYAYQLRGRGFRRCCLGRPWVLLRIGSWSFILHTHEHTHTHTHIRAHKHTCRKAAEVCVHRKENIRWPMHASKTQFLLSKFEIHRTAFFFHSLAMVNKIVRPDRWALPGVQGRRYGNVVCGGMWGWNVMVWGANRISRRRVARGMPWRYADRQPWSV